MKKKILMVLCLVAVALLSIGGTVAYLTDEESSTAVYTIGDIDIKMLEDVISDGEVMLMPGEKINPNIRVKNVGENDAYVWVTVAIPTTLGDPNDASKNILHWNASGKYLDAYYQNDAYKEDGVTTVTYEETWHWPLDENNRFIYKTVTSEDGIEYYVYTFLYNGVLSSGVETGTLVNGTYLDVKVDYNEDTGKWVFVEKGVETELEHDFSKNAAMEITAYAIQAAGFESVDEAYAAYQAQWTAK